MFVVGAAIPSQAAAPPVQIPVHDVTFEPNVGQTDTRVKYLAHSAHSTLWLLPDEAVLESAARADRKSAVLKLRFRDANAAPRLEAEERRTGVSNYFIGRDPNNWHTGIPQFGKVRYHDVYPGIDIVFYGNSTELEYDFVVSAGADPSRIKLDFEGVDSLRADDSGDLVVNVAGIEMRSRKPRIYQKTAAGEEGVNGRYVLTGKKSAGFAIDTYDRGRALVVDPILSYASFMGGEGTDVASAMAMDAQGNVYLTGSTNSSQFPTKAALYPGLKNATNVAFIAKFNPAASGAESLIFSTYLGGDDSDEAFGLALDKNNNIYVTGRTLSNNFPLKNAFQTSFDQTLNCKDSGGNAATCDHSFVTELAANGKSLIYSSYIGGTNQDEAFAIAVDGGGNAYITGQTFSTDFPTAGSPYQSKIKSAPDVFLSVVAAGGTSLSYSTYFGGSKTETPVSIAVTPAGTAYIVGTTRSSDLPTTSNALQGKPNGGPGDSFIAGFNPKNGGTGSLTYSSYLGGKNGSTVANAVALDAAGVVYITGATNADDYPVSQNAYASKYSGSLSAGGIAGLGDAFVTKLDTSSSGSGQVVYSTFYGGALDDDGLALAVDPQGRITVAGQTNSLALPVTGDAFQKFDAGPSPTPQGFLARFDPSKSGKASLFYATYLGGNQADQLVGVAVDATGNIVTAVGTVQSTNPPVTPNALQTVYGGGTTSYGVGSNAYVVEFDFTRSGPIVHSVVNGASLVDTGLAPGMIFALLGAGIGPSTPVVGGADVDGRIPTTLGGVELYVDNIAVPLLYVSSNQINAIAPYELANRLGGSVSLRVYYNGVGSSLISDLVLIAAPAIFTAGGGQGIVMNEDGSFNSASNPAATGSKIRIFGTGEGLLRPAGSDGLYTDVNNPPRPVLPVVAMIGGANASVTYAGTVPGSFEGFFEVDAKVPGGLTGKVPVELIVGGIASSPAYIVVK